MVCFQVKVNWAYVMLLMLLVPLVPILSCGAARSQETVTTVGTAVEGRAVSESAVTEGRILAELRRWVRRGGNGWSLVTSMDTTLEEASFQYRWPGLASAKSDEDFQRLINDLNSQSQGEIGTKAAGAEKTTASSREYFDMLRLMKPGPDRKEAVLRIVRQGHRSSRQGSNWAASIAARLLTVQSRQAPVLGRQITSSLTLTGSPCRILEEASRATATPSQAVFSRCRSRVWPPQATHAFKVKVEAGSTIGLVLESLVLQVGAVDGQIDMNWSDDRSRVALRWFIEPVAARKRP